VSYSVGGALSETGKPQIRASVTMHGSVSLPCLRDPTRVQASMRAGRRRSSTSTISALSHVPLNHSRVQPPVVQNKMGTASTAVRIKGATTPMPHSMRQQYTAPYRLAYQDLARKEYLHELEILFQKIDEDGSGLLELDELQRSMRHKDVVKAFANLKVQPHQSEVIFKSLDKNRLGELTIQEFCNGLGLIVGEMPETGELDVEKLRAKHRSRKNCENGEAPAPPLVSESDAPALPQVRLQKAFVHSASAKAMVPGTVFNKHAPPPHMRG